jgi:hypothetical protein
VTSDRIFFHCASSNQWCSNWNLLGDKIIEFCATELWDHFFCIINFLHVQTFIIPFSDTSVYVHMYANVGSLLSCILFACLINISLLLPYSQFAVLQFLGTYNPMHQMLHYCMCTHKTTQKLPNIFSGNLIFENY